MVCCVRVATNRQWTSVHYGSLSARFEQSFTFSPESHLYSISMHHNKELSQSLILDSTFEKEEGSGLLMLGSIQNQAFPTKLKHISRAVYATGNPEYCKAALVEYEITLSVPALKQIKKLAEHQQLIVNRQQSPPRLVQLPQIPQLVSEITVASAVDINNVTSCVKQNQRLEIEEDEEKVIFKDRSAALKTRDQSRLITKLINIRDSEDRNNDSSKIKIQNSETGGTFSKRSFQLAQQSNAIIQKSKTNRQESEYTEKSQQQMDKDEEDIIKEKEFHVLQDIVRSRQQQKRSHISSKRKNNYSKPQGIEPVSPTKSGSFSERNPSEYDKGTVSELIQNFTKYSHANGRSPPSRQSQFGSQISGTNETSPQKERKPTFQMQLNTIQPVQEEDDETTDKLYRRKTENNMGLTPASPIKTRSREGFNLLAVPPEQLPLLSPRRVSHSRLSRFSKKTENYQRMRSYLESSGQQRSHNPASSNQEYLILNTIILQNLDRQSEARPTCLMLQHQSTILYTESICEKSILFTRQVIPLRKLDGNVLHISAYEEFNGKRILFGKAQTTLTELRKCEQFRTLKLAIEICSIKVGELMINHEFSSVHPNNKETVRTRQYSLQQQTINRYSSGSERKQPFMRKSLIKSPQVVLVRSSLLPPLSSNH